jgi:hypothetical protein
MSACAQTQSMTAARKSVLSRNLFAEGEKIPVARRIEEQSGVVVVDLRGCGSRELSEIYQAFALLCARQAVRGALLKTGDEDADAHYALRDTLVTVARIAGIPLRFRLALVAGFRPTEEVFRTLQTELRALGCDTQVFRMEPQAVQWLCGATRRPARARTGEAALR